MQPYLLSLDYDVYGIIRRNSSVESQQSRFSEEVRNKVNVYYGDLLDQGCLEKLLDEIQPDEIYNLAAQSHVRVSFDIPQFTRDNIVNNTYIKYSSFQSN
jgi:GDPmannose 4,6-dehydratase